MSVRNRHPASVYSRPTHSGYFNLLDGGTEAPAVKSGALGAVEKTGQSFSEARDGEQSQSMDIAPEAVRGYHVALRSLTRDLFAETIIPPEVLGTLPTLPDADYPQGVLVFLTTDEKLYRNTDGSTWSVAVDGADIIADSITAGQIAAGAIGATEIAAGAIQTTHFQATAAAPEVSNSDSSVVIDPSGIYIANGKIVLEDYSGQSVLGPAGFAGTWIRFVSGGVYNGDFLVGSASDIAVTEVSGADSEADYDASLTSDFPYWIVAESGATLKQVADTAASQGLAMQSSAGAGVNRFYQDIPVVPGLAYQAHVRHRYTITSGSIDFSIYLSWRDSTHAIIGTRDFTSWSLNATEANYLSNRKYLDIAGDSIPDNAPGNASYLRVEVEVSLSSSAQTHWVSDVSVEPATIYASRWEPAHKGAVIQSLDGNIELTPALNKDLQIFKNGDSDPLFSVDTGNSILLLGAGTSSPTIALSVSGNELVIDSPTGSGGRSLRIFDDLNVYGTLDVGAITGMSGWQSYTPSITGGGTATYSIRTGSYQKIGKMVMFSIELKVNSAGSGGTTIQIGLPSTVGVENQVCVGYNNSFTTFLTGATTGLMNSGGNTTFALDKNGVLLTRAHFATNALLRLTGWYMEA